MLRSLAPVLQRIAAGAAKVSVTCPALLPPLDFPAEIIERITVNLVRNAAEAIRSQQSSTYAEAFPRCGEIRVALTVVASRLQLTVEDNGPGMPPAIAAAFLQPTPLPYGASRGLGHRIIHELATTSAGQLSIRVLPGKGTVFCLKWPIPNTELLDPRRDLSTLSVKTPPEGSSAC
jgi:signal transduction histidine kinase